MNRAGVVILAIALFLLIKGEAKPILAQMFEKGNAVYGFLQDLEKPGKVNISIIDSYMPVVGYVESHYIETEYLKDPSYVYEENIEYIDIEENEEPVIEETSDIEMETATEKQKKNGKKKNTKKNETTAAESTTIQLYNKSDLLDLNSLLDRFYTVTSITELKEDKFNIAQALEQDMTLHQDN